IGKNVMMPANAIKRHVVVEDRIKALKEFAETTELNIVEENGSKIGVITAGIAYAYAKEALGDKADYLKLGMVYPLPEKKLIDFAKKYDKVYVIEELDPVIENECKALGIEVLGKDLFTLLGEYTPTMIKSVVLGEAAPEVIVPEEAIPMRPPF
ncbi:MAG: indolepyruvate ferredoxin oxidoreductase subunit alpha, partial [Clostridia bacterium]|nr:indolepyruvate ferredoxin oxidoreductase subunit alpha [Clostridia bacterium]